MLGVVVDEAEVEAWREVGLARGLTGTVRWSLSVGVTSVLLGD